MRIKTLLLLALLAPAIALTAQSNKEEIELYQSIFGMEKKEVTKQLISPADDKQEAFWKIYDEYETERKAIGQQRIALIEKYAEMYAELNAENVGPLVKEATAIRDKRNALIHKYHQKISKAVDPIAAAQFYQLENYYAAEISVALYRNIPMVGELIVK